ncbi:STY4851/ECs_5259 family protein [Sinorhizobium meliloti]|uniref:STY4851/ECs_5259 family protein n=1 Tax=Rhizobium meliloti TaxID=382 RepID=UPI0023808022|nr:STY4851/ECs_5259 family protein [Sinorhizobium meliloti]MDE4593042.1 STY4851/ECs_5259 family protein [Sinorhizobium meliloti]
MHLNSLDDDSLRKEFERSYHHLWALEQLNDILKKRYSDAAIDLQLLVVKRLRELRNVPSAASTPSDPASAWTTAFLSRRNLKAPDGQPFHRYRMTDTEFSEAGVVLRGLAARRKLIPDERTACGVFAAFCAEWFRREATSTFRKWDALAPDIFPAIHGNQKREMAENGLRFWRRPLLEINGANEYLLSLALEGGVPVKVIADEGAGWLRDYLRHLLRFALAGQEVAAVRGYAHDESYRIKLSYRNDAFVDLCAELAAEVAKWRTVVESEAIAGIDPVSFLDAKYPTWKESIPVYLPTGADSAARVLLTGLIAEKIEAFSSHGIGCERFLSLEGGVWEPALRIQATGDIPIGRLPGVSTATRWRATPSGILADYLPSQFALFEPPSDDQHTWRVRPLADLSRMIVGFPLSATASVNITANNSVHVLDWPNGQRVTSDVLVFDEVEPSEAPSLLRLVKTGSSSLPSKRLFVLVPTAWTTEASDEDLGRTWQVGDRKLIEVTGTCYISEAGVPEAGRYRIQAGSEQRDETIELTSRSSPGISAAGDFDVMEAPVRVVITRNGAPRPIERDELFVRQSGGPWRALPRGEIPDVGMVELSWRDPKASIQIEKRRIAVVPAGASVKGLMKTATTGRILLTELPGWRLARSNVANAVWQNDAGNILFEFNGKPNYRQPALLEPPEGKPIPILIPIAARDAVIVNAGGEVVDAGQQMDLASLRGSRAISSHKSVLVISRRASKAQDISVEVDGEFAISTLKPTIEQIMASVDDQDVQLDMSFVGDCRQSIRLTRYRWDRPRQDHGAVSFPAVGVAVCRPVLAPEVERTLDHFQHAQYRLPEDVYGPCLVYLRDGPDILTRPLLLIGAADVPALPSGSLRTALCLRNYGELQTAIAERLEKLWCDPSAIEDLAYIRLLIGNLDGLPPTAFEALKHLPHHPKTLVRLLLGAADEKSRVAVWGLQGQLPFIWLGISLECWKCALDVERSTIENALAEVPGTDEFRLEILVKYFRDKLASLVEIEPSLATVFSALGFPLAPRTKPLENIIEDFIKDQRSREAEDSSSVVRAAPLARRVSELGLAVPNGIGRRFSLGDFDALYAPVLLAASARGLAIIDPDLEVPLRAALHENGAFVSEAYPHFFNFFRTKQ